MRVVFAGTPEVALASLDAIAASSHELVAVLTRPDAPAGRGRKLTPSPVAQRAEALGIEVLKPGHPRDEEFQAELKRLEVDCCPVVAYGALLPRSALDLARLGWVNLHFSLLPRWRGAAPVQHALLHGDEFSGATTFRIVEELDAGPTYGMMTERVLPGDTSGQLLGRLAEGGAQLLVATLDGLESGQLEERAQQADGVTYAPKINVEDAQVRWNEPVAFVDRRIRACTPAPGAWTTFDGERLKLGPVVADDSVATLAARRGAGRQECRPRRYPQHTGQAGAGQAVRQEGDGRSGLGARCPGRERCGPWLTRGRPALADLVGGHRGVLGWTRPGRRRTTCCAGCGPMPPT